VPGRPGHGFDRRTLGSYSAVTCLAGLTPILGLLALLLFWNQPSSNPSIHALEVE